MHNKALNSNDTQLIGYLVSKGHVYIGHICSKGDVSSCYIPWQLELYLSSYPRETIIIASGLMPPLWDILSVSLNELDQSL
jgi:hypothetical protein